MKFVIDYRDTFLNSCRRYQETVTAAMFMHLFESLCPPLQVLSIYRANKPTQNTWGVWSTIGGWNPPKNMTLHKRF
jgi:hypothetical protein